MDYERKRYPYLELSEAKNNIAFAISLAVPNRFIKACPAITGHVDLSNTSSKGVRIGPGQTVFTRKPIGVSSSAAVRASPLTAHLLGINLGVK
jgi:hypothetical protein